MTYYNGIIWTAVLLVLAVVAGVIVNMVRRGTLVNNGFIGIRTPQTRASEEAWQAGHRAAVPLLRWVMWAAIASAILLLIATFVLPQLMPTAAEEVIEVGGWVFLGLVVVLLLAAAWKGNGAAREVNDRSR